MNNDSELMMWKVILKQNREVAWKCRYDYNEYLFVSGVMTPAGNVAMLLGTRWWDEVEGDEVAGMPTFTELNDAVKAPAMLSTLPDEEEARKVHVTRARGKMLLYCGLDLGFEVARTLARICGFKRSEALMCGDDAPYLVKMLGADAPSPDSYGKEVLSEHIRH